MDRPSLSARGTSRSMQEGRRKTRSPGAWQQTPKSIRTGVERRFSSVRNDIGHETPHKNARIQSEAFAFPRSLFPCSLVPWFPVPLFPALFFAKHFKGSQPEDAIAGDPAGCGGENGGPDERHQRGG